MANYLCIPTIKATCSLVTPQQWHKVITSIPRLTDVALVAKDRVLSL